MSIKFFGQYLIEEGEVDAAQLREGLDLLSRTNKALGEIAVEQGMMSRQDADAANLQQRSIDKPYGDLCVELGLLTSQQLVECLRIQSATRLLIGQALVQLGHLSEDRLSEMLDRFKVDQAPYAVSGTASLPDPLSNNRIAPYVVDLLPKFALRVAGITVKIGHAQLLEEVPNLPYRVSVPIHGPRGLDVTLIGDSRFCRKLAAAAAGMGEAALDEDLITDGVGEFLNVLCGNTMCALERDGVSTELGVPDRNAEVADGWIFELATTTGRASLVLSQF